MAIEKLPSIRYNIYLKGSCTLTKKNIIFLLGLLIIVLLAYAALKFLSKDENLKEVGKSEPVIQKNQGAISSVAPEHPQPDVAIDDQAVVKKPLASILENKPEQPPRKAPIPKLNLQVQSVFLGKGKDSGYALIAYNGTPPQVYIVGATLTEGVLLKELSTDEITIDNRGKLEKYQVVKAKATAKKPVKPAPELPPKLVNDTPPMDDFTPPPPYEEPLKTHLTPAQSPEYEFTPPPPDEGMRPE
jgi:type II secretory pathway component PulC